VIRFKSVSVQNFLSYGAVPTKFDLDNGGTTLIVGEDLDNTASGTGANGVGKTVWLNALIFGLYGKPVSNISLDNLVNNINNTHMEVIVEFEKDGKVYTVKRVRKEKGKTPYAKVFQRDVGKELDWGSKTQDVTPDSIKHITEFIENILGIPYELFIHIVAFSASGTPFLDLPVRHASQTNQSAIMEELFRLNQLSFKASLLKEEIKNTKQSLDIKQKHNEQLIKEHERHNAQTEAAKQRVDDWIEDNKTDIKKETKLLKDLEKHDIDAQQKLFDKISEDSQELKDIEDNIKDTNTKIKEQTAEYRVFENEFKLLDQSSSNAEVKREEWELNHKNKLEEYEAAKGGLVSEDILKEQTILNETLETMYDQQGEIKSDIIDIKNNITNTTSKIKRVKEELSHLEDSKCPYCLQKYENADVKIASSKEDLANLNKTLGEDEESLKSSNNLSSKLNDEISEFEKAITHNIKEISIEEQLRVDLLKEIDKLRTTENPHTNDYTVNEKRLKELDSMMEAIDMDVANFTTDVQNMELERDTLEEAINKIIDKLEFSSLEDLYEVKSNIKHTKANLKSLKDSVNPHLESYNELMDMKLESVDMNAINDLDKLLTHQNYLLKLLTKKDSFIRKNLLNKNLIFLNQRLRGYLQDLGLPHRVEFTKEMTAGISQFGRTLDFGNLSSGQKARVNLALSFSFRDVLQHSLDSVNVCMLDEVLDVGLDAVGVQNAARMLKRKARDDDMSLYIISHRDEVSGIFDKKLVVQMDKGFSKVLME